MKIGKLEIKWVGYSRRHAKKMIKRVYAESLINDNGLDYHKAYVGKIMAIKWHRNYTNMVRAEYCSLKESKELVEKVLGKLK